MEVDHYEIFPAAGVLLPKELRALVGVIYQVARTADDIADEGVFDPAERQIDEQICDDAWRALMRHEAAHARTMIAGGAPLAVRSLVMRLCGRLGGQSRSVES
jgi:phytoene/squalene synthetase